MESSVLVYNLHKSLYQRLLYALVDSNIIAKAITEEEVRVLLRTVRDDTKIIQDLKNFDGEKFRMTKKTPVVLENYFSTVKKNILKEIPNTNEEGKYFDQLDPQGKMLARQIKKFLIPRLKERYPDNNEEEQVLLDYLKLKHPEETITNIKDQIGKYESDLKIVRDRKKEIDDKERAEKDAITTEQIKASELASAARKIQREKEKAEKESSKSESQKLLDTWTREAVKRNESYKSFMSLLNLVGSLYTPSKDNILRLKKFLDEEKISEEDKNALTKILTELEKEFKESKITARNVNISPSQIESKELGIQIGSSSTFNRSRDGKRTTSIKIKYGIDETRKISDLNFFNTFTTIDLTRDTWFSNPYLREIGMYWANKSGFSDSAEDWINLSNDKKYEFINKIKDILPEYPDLKVGKKANISSLVTLYVDVWEDYVVNEETKPEDFAYFLQGIGNGLSKDNRDSAVGDFGKLRMFQNDILPKLINAIKKGVVVDENNNLSFNLGPRFTKILKAYGDKREVTSVIEDLIDIAKGEGLSSKYQGRDADELTAIEDNIINMLEQKIEGETMLSFIITTFMRLYDEKTILRRLLKLENTAIDVEFLTPSEIISEPKNTKPKEKYEGKRFGVPKGKIAGAKTRAFVDRETKRLSEEKDEEGNPKYTEQQIHRLVGWKAVPSKRYKRDANNKILRDSDDKPIMENYTDYQKYDKKFYKNLEETKKSLDNLLVVLGEQDDILIKEDVGLILESLNKKQKKKIKAILNIADPTEYFGHDFLKLSELIRLLRTLGVVKGDKKLNKKVLRLDDENIKVVKLATRLRKDYENLYRELREMIYPKSGE
jgi:hypothetical protein|tara:strand:+ start:2316 stop:4817 length:2502 start_codon:yes stop_codon:yes gene_type:complete